MGLGQYQVDVLHYINPHLIWALVRKEGEKNSFHFEQIGMYGILPQNITFGVDCVIKHERCEQWMPAASVVMKRCFLDADHVLFTPNYIDKQYSIFDDNTHKYGQLIVVKKNGDKVNILNEIVNSEFAFEDESLFQQELRGSNLKIQLGYISAHEIISKIGEALKTRDIPKNIWMDALNNQTSVFHEVKNLESLKTSRKAEVSDCDDAFLKNKLNVSKVCKGADEISLGRGYGRRTPSSASSILSVTLRKKLEWLEAQSIHNQANKTLHSENPPKPVQANDVTNAIHSDKKTNDAFEDQQNNNSVSPKNKNHSSGDDNNTNIIEGQNPRRKIATDTKLVAFGPPGLPPNKFAIKQQSNVEKEEPVKEEKRKPVPEGKYEVKKEQDVYADIDSEVNLKISNLEILKRIKSMSSMQSKAEVLNVRVRYLKENQSKINDSLSSVLDKQSSKCELDSELEEELQEKIDLSRYRSKKNVNSESLPKIVNTDTKKTNVNPFKNIDGSISVFVDKLVGPVLMVHTKKDNRIEPVSNMRDIPFGNDIHNVLRNMSVQKPMRPQTVSWPTILRGHSLFLIGPYNSGNTMGYLPAVCRLVYDFKNTPDKFGLSCIIVCATSHSVAFVESKCKMFLHSAKIFACQVGMSDLDITTSLLNGCDLLICTPSMLAHLIQEDFSLDFRNLSTFVIDDCEHISSIYPKELKFVLLKVMDIVKNRVHKEWKVQYIIVSRIWCDFMSSLAKKAPDSVICISAFEECVLYSKAATSVEFVNQENKITSVINFMNDIDKSKKTVIVCRADDEVELVEKALTQLNYVVFSCDSTMTVQDLYNLDKTFNDYEEPVLGPILVCCDGNLTHLNVTDGHYLIHYSLPDLFSMFCKRFAVLNDNYPSIFKEVDNNIKIKILFDENNIEQLPKILQFIKRCTVDVPPFLDEISSGVLIQKYLKKAQNLVPICRSLLTLGKCPDYWNCVDRHAIFKEFDSPKPWLPKEGVITFQIIYYHSAVYYSARLTSSIVSSNVVKYSQTYSLLSFKMGMYYSKEENRKLHGIPKVGDVCAVTLKLNLFVRCQVCKVLKSERNQPTILQIKLIDEERYEMAHDTSLYYLPDELKNIETHVVTVILANIMPQDKDVTFSKLAENQLRRVTQENDELYMRGQIAMVVGNIIFVDTLEACQDLSFLEEVVIKSDFRKELLDGYAIPNPDHIDNLRKVCDFTSDVSEKEQTIEVANFNSDKVLPKGEWAYLECGEQSLVYVIGAQNPCQFFVQLTKFYTSMNTLINDIKQYLTTNPEPVENIVLGDIVIAEFPEDGTYERARIDSNITNSKVKCFFVDQGCWKDVSIKKIYPITEELITQLPFQAIECRLIGIKPPGANWTDFSTNFFLDSCGYYDKQLYAEYYTKEKAEFTEGHKYGVVLIDTESAENINININLMLLDKNLADENDEIELLNDYIFEGPEDFEYVSFDECIQTDSKMKTALPVNDNNDQTQHTPSGNLDDPLAAVPSENLETRFELAADDFGNILGSLPISQIISIKEEATDTEWNEKVLATAIEDSVRPSNKIRELNVSTESTTVSKPQLLWRQNKNTVTIKIRLIVDDYVVTIKDRSMKFSAYANDRNYGFDFELYGVVNVKKCFHCNKGLYVQVKLWKFMATNWLTLTRDSSLKKWIVFDTDSFDVSSDEEPAAIVIPPEKFLNFDSDDSEVNFADDSNAN